MSAITLTREIAPGITVTVCPLSVRQSVYRRALVERFGEAFAPAVVGATVAERWTWFVLCAAQTVGVQGMTWTPPGMFVDLEGVRVSFEAWLSALPDGSAITAWLMAVTEANTPEVPPELTPEGAPRTGEDADPKG